MRVALNGHFLHHPATGSGQYLIQLLRGLARDGRVEPVVLCDGRAPSPPGGWPGRAAPCFVDLPAARLAGDAAKVWWEQVLWPRLVARSGAQVGHVPYFAPPLVRRGPASIVATIHDVIPLILPHYVTSPLVRLYNALVSRGARRADIVLVDSQASRRDVVRLLGVPEARVRVVYLGVDEALFVSIDTAQRDAVCRRYGLRPPFVLYLGGFDARKNVPALLRALALLPSTVSWQLAIAGRLPPPRPPLFPDLPRLVEELGLGSRVRFLGYIAEEEKPALFRAAACFAYPSIYEGFGLDPLAALACGVPVVCSNRASLPELMGEAALLVDPDDLPSFAAALKRVLTDADLRAELARRGPQQAAKFRWEETVRQTVAAYEASLVPFISDRSGQCASS